MTWQEFVDAVEVLGVKPTDDIELIDVVTRCYGTTAIRVGNEPGGWRILGD